jgi:hypothetical protein
MFKGFLNRINRCTTIKAVVFIDADHNVLALGQWAIWQGFESVFSHDYGMALCNFFEPFQIFGDMPKQIIVIL